jgi:hypothetical protein
LFVFVLIVVVDDVVELFELLVVGIFREDSPDREERSNSNGFNLAST